MQQRQRTSARSDLRCTDVRQPHRPACTSTSTSQCQHPPQQGLLALRPASLCHQIPTRQESQQQPLVAVHRQRWTLLSSLQCLHPQQKQPLRPEAPAAAADQPAVFAASQAPSQGQPAALPAAGRQPTTPLLQHTTPCWRRHCNRRAQGRHPPKCLQTVLLLPPQLLLQGSRLALQGTTSCFAWLLALLLPRIPSLRQQRHRSGTGWGGQVRPAALAWQAAAGLAASCRVCWLLMAAPPLVLAVPCCQHAHRC